MLNFPKSYTNKYLLLVLLLTINNPKLFSQSSIFISSDNKIGIGTENPVSELDLFGDFNITGNILLDGMIGDSGSVLINDGINGLKWDNTFRRGIWNLVDSNAVFRSGNVLIDKTLVNRAHYIDSAGTIFNKWLPNIEGYNYQPPFFFTGGRFPNIGYEDNYVYNFGSNLGYGGGAFEQGISAYGIGFENNFYINNKPYNEFHILAVDNSGIQRRPLYSLFAHDGSQLEMINQLSGLSLHDRDNTKQLYRIDTNGEIMSYNGLGFRHIFNTTNYSPLWQMNHLGSVFPLIGIKDKNILLSDDTLDCVVKLGSTLFLGHKNDTTHFLRPISLNSSFEIGDSAHSYQSIKFHSNSQNILKLSNNNSLNSINLSIDSIGSFILTRGSSNKYIFRVQDSVETNIFEVHANGNVTLGDSINNLHKLNISGNLQLTGGIVINNDMVEEGQVLTFNQSGSLLDFKTNIANRFEEVFIAENNQTTFLLSTTLPPISNNIVPIEVFLNGVKLKHTSGSVIGRKFSYQSNSVILPPLNQGDEVEIVYFK